MAEFDDRTMTVGQWFLTMLILAIPFVNLLMLIVWAAGVGNRNRVNFCRASLLWTLIVVVLYVVFVLVLGLGTGAFAPAGG